MRIGEYQLLEVVRDSPHGLFLTDGDQDILLPGNQCPPDLEIGDEVRVFVYTDSEDRPIATMRQPYAAVGEFAYLRVLAINSTGAFLDWGLEKDLICPYGQQRKPLREGQRALVRVYLDEISNRVVCSTRLERFLKKEGAELTPGQAVQIIVWEIAPDAIRVVVDNQFQGAIFPDEWHEELRPGERRSAFVKSVRDADQKIAISLRPQGFTSVLFERERVLSALREVGGTLRVSDKSSPKEIQQRFGLSKGAFKKLIGALYREKLIEIRPDSIRLLE